MNYGQLIHSSPDQQVSQQTNVCVTEECKLPTQAAKADLRALMAQYVLPGINSIADNSQLMGTPDATMAACTALKRMNAALLADDAKELEKCFFTKQAFWKDQLALTWHLRTFISPANIAKGLLETRALRSMTGGFEIEGDAKFIQIGQDLVS